MRFIVFILLVFFGRSYFSQNETKRWYFGNGAGLNFNANPPSLSTNGALTSTVGCSSISDNLGNLLFYTDGVSVWDKTHNLMANGAGLFGNNCAQSSIIIKQPGNTNLYYIFTVQGGGGAAGFNYSIVDISLAVGNGSVTTKNASIFSQPCQEKLTAVKHCNGTDIWIVIHEMNSGFRSYLLSSSGISSPVISTVGSGGSGPSTLGTMKVSPNGKKLGLTFNQYNTTTFLYTTYLKMFNFDNTTGLVSGTLSYNSSFVNWASAHIYGTEFSPDGTKFYATMQGGILQFDLCNPLFNAAFTLVSTVENSSSDNQILKGSLQLAADGKIYVARVGQTSLGVINNPNNPSASVNYVHNGLSLGTYTCGYGLPNFVSSYFEKRNKVFAFNSNPLVGCKIINFQAPVVCSGSGYTITSTQWNFGDPVSGSTNTSLATNPTHTFSSVGDFTTQLIVTYDCGKADTIVKIIPLTSPTLVISSPAHNCNVGTASVTTMGGTGSYSYTWTPSLQTGTVVTNLSDGNYTVSMIDNGQGCSGSASASISVITLSAVIGSSSLSCYSSSNGTASITVSGGSNTYSYLWSPGSYTSQAISAITAGLYTVAALDLANNCSITKTVQISQPAALNAVIIAPTTTACVGSTLVLLGGATGGSPAYNFSWSSGATHFTDTIQALSAGNFNYSLTVTDLNNCLHNTNVSLNFIDNPLLVAPTVSICALGTATMSVTGAANYTWQPGGFTGSTFTVSPLVSTNYAITGALAGCSSTLTTSIFVLSNPTISLSNNSPLCVGQTLQLNSNTGVSYFWSGPAGFSSSSQNPNFTSSSASQSGNYNLVLTSAYGCTTAANTSVTIKALPTLSVSGNFTICHGTKTNVSATGADTYNWSNGLLNNPIVLSPSVSTTYTLSGTSYSTSCSSSIPVTISVLECTALHEYAKVDLIKIYPNPTQGKITLEIITSSRISLVNSLGQIIKDDFINAGKYILDLSDYNNGVYFLKIEAENKTFRIIKE